MSDGAFDQGVFKSSIGDNYYIMECSNNCQEALNLNDSLLIYLQGPHE